MQVKVKLGAVAAAELLVAAGSAGTAVAAPETSEAVSAPVTQLAPTDPQNVQDVYCGGSDDACVTAQLYGAYTGHLEMRGSGYAFRTGKIWIDGWLENRATGAIVFDLPDKSCSNTTQCATGPHYKDVASDGTKYRLHICAWRSGISSSQICTTSWVFA